MATFMDFEASLANGFFSVLGSPAFEGIAVVSFFMAAVFLAPTHPALKVLAFFGGVLLAIPFLGLAVFLWGFGLGIIIWFAVRRFWG